MTTENKKKTWLDHAERFVDNITRILWVILLATWLWNGHML